MVPLHIVQMTKSHAGKAERVFVDLEAIYPNPHDPSEEMSIEEVRAACRGWLQKRWPKSHALTDVNNRESQMQLRGGHKNMRDAVRLDNAAENKAMDVEDGNAMIETMQEGFADEDCSPVYRTQGGQRLGFMEVKGETQTSKLLHVGSSRALY